MGNRLGRGPLGGNVYGSDDWVDGEETVGNRLGRAPWGSGEMEATRRWTDGKPSDERVDGKETVGNSMGRAPVGRTDTGVTTVDGRETVGNSLGRAPLGRSDAEATIGWTEGKPWEIAWGELRGEGAIRKRRQGGRKGNRGK